MISLINNQRGVSAVIVGICLFMIVGFVALAIDIGHIYVVRNELQNAADAGALAGARHLYKEGIFEVNPNANLIAMEAAIANTGDNKNVEVISPETNADDVQRGHWSFNSRTFSAWDGLTPPPIWGVGGDELDSMTEFVNAVQVVTRRDSQPITSFFAGIFGYDGFKASAVAVAYLSSASAFTRADFDVPIAVCAQSLTTDGTYQDYQDCMSDSTCTLDCNIGRMLDSSGKQDTTNTAAWTNFSGGEWSNGEEDPCSTANASEMNDLVCPEEKCDPSDCTGDYDPCCKTFGIGGDGDSGSLGATGGVQQVTFDKFRECWQTGRNCFTVEETEGVFIEDCSEVIDSEGGMKDPWGMDVPDKPWKLKMPVVDCPGHNVSNCPKLVGAVEVSLMWITQGGTPDPSLDTPYKMKVDDGNYWPKTDAGGLYEGSNGLPESLSSLVPYGLPSNYLENDLQVSSNLCAIPPTESIPANIPKLGGDTALSTTVSDIYSDLGLDPDVYLSNYDPIYPDLSQLENGHQFQFFDIKDPGLAAPDPNQICGIDDYKALLMNHLADAAGHARWASFVKYFQLKNWDDSWAPLTKKSIFFLPSCEAVEPSGKSGNGGFFGIMAKYPVLVD